jgi:hypothetical protein
MSSLSHACYAFARRYRLVLAQAKKPDKTKTEKLAQANARAAKNKSLRARCAGLEARK